MQYPLQKKYIELITKPFKKEYYTALNNISMNIEAGDRIAFLGPNGAGKTTLLKIIGGLLYPTSGYTTVNGYNTVKDNLKARKNVGFILNDERSFYWRLTGLQNLEFFGSLDKLHGQRLHEKVNELLHLVGLDESRRKLFAGYSSGMKQRLAIARGLLSDPEILILDEPTRTLDPISAEDISNIISNKIRDKTLLIATHSLKEAQTLCNKICMILNGKILLFQDINKVIDQYGTLENSYRKVIGNLNQQLKNKNTFKEQIDEII